MADCWLTYCFIWLAHWQIYWLMVSQCRCPLLSHHGWKRLRFRNVGHNIYPYCGQCGKIISSATSASWNIRVCDPLCYYYSNRVKALSVNNFEDMYSGPQNNCELRWLLEVDTWEGGGYMLRQTVGHRAHPLLFPSFSPSYCEVSQARSYFASAIMIKHFFKFQ
jgi:hypothetical protein